MMIWVLEVLLLAASFCWAHRTFDRIAFKYGHRQQQPYDTLRSPGAWVANIIAAVAFVAISEFVGTLYTHPAASHLFVLIGGLLPPIELLIYREWARHHAKDLRIQP